MNTPNALRSSRRIMLVGGAGLIGSALAVRLVTSGHQVVIVDDLSVNNLRSDTDLARPGVNRPLYETVIRWRLARLESAGVALLLENARSFQAVSAIAESFNPEIVIDLAAVSHASRSNADPQRAFENGEEVLQVCLEIARLHGVERLIYLSSSMVIGDFPSSIVDETVQCDPMGIYGALKLGGEVLVRAYSRVYGFDHTIIRPAAAYGPGCIGRRFVQASIESALGGQPISVPGDGSEVVDFTYVDDIAAGLQRMIESEAAANETFNLTAGNARSLADVAQIVQELIPGTQVISRERNHLVPRRGTLAIEKARSLVGYAPEVTLEEGIARYILWYRELAADNPALLRAQEPVIND